MHVWLCFLRQELEQLRTRIQTLEEDRSKLAQAELSPFSPTTQENHEDTQDTAGLQEGEEKDTGGQEKEGEGAEKRSENGRKKEREKAASIIQTNWREYRNRVCNRPQLCKKTKRYLKR